MGRGKGNETLSSNFKVEAHKHWREVWMVPQAQMTDSPTLWGCVWGVGWEIRRGRGAKPFPRLGFLGSGP